MCEFYWAYATFYDLMDLTEELFSTIATEVCGSPIITYQGTELDLTPGKWQRLTFHESLEKIGGHSPRILQRLRQGTRLRPRTRGKDPQDGQARQAAGQAL